MYVSSPSESPSSWGFTFLKTLDGGDRTGAQKSPGQHVDKLREEPLVHVARHLVKHLKKETQSHFIQACFAHQPVPDGAVLDVVANWLVLLGLDEVATNLPL